MDDDKKTRKALNFLYTLYEGDDPECQELIDHIAEKLYSTMSNKFPKMG